MKIHLTTDIQKRLICALEKACPYEIGGVLMGEHIDEAEFRIVDLTIQEQLGSVAFFIRLVADIVKRSWVSRQKFDGEKEAHLIALACSDPPEGHARWTLRLLAEEMVELNHFSSISHECIRQVLKKKRTGYNYRKFNYIGEWHSHPSFQPVPSEKDLQSMQEIVTDSDTSANFAILLIVRLKRGQEIDATATVFFRDGKCFECQLIMEKMV